MITCSITGTASAKPGSWFGEGVYLLEEHLNRLERVSDALFLSWPFGRSELRTILLETARAAEID
ncbi:MAG: hypothetical protein V5B78_03345 [Desulfohalobiaceae bacterium]